MGLAKKLNQTLAYLEEQNQQLAKRDHARVPTGSREFRHDIRTRF